MPRICEKVMWTRKQRKNLDYPATAVKIILDKLNRLKTWVDFLLAIDFRENDQSKLAWKSCYNTNDKRKERYLPRPYHRIEKSMKHESDGDTNCNMCARYSHQRIDSGTELGNKRSSGDHPNYWIVDIGLNTEKSSGDVYLLLLRHQWKTIS